MKTFYLGTHQPHWLWTTSYPLFVSHRQLARRRTPLRPATWRPSRTSDPTSSARA